MSRVDLMNFFLPLISYVFFSPFGVDHNVFWLQLGVLQN